MGNYFSFSKDPTYRTARELTRKAKTEHRKRIESLCRDKKTMDDAVEKITRYIAKDTRTGRMLMSSGTVDMDKDVWEAVLKSQRKRITSSTSPRYAIEITQSMIVCYYLYDVDDIVSRIRRLVLQDAECGLSYTYFNKPRDIEDHVWTDILLYNAETIKKKLYPLRCSLSSMSTSIKVDWY